MRHVLSSLLRDWSRGSGCWSWCPVLPDFKNDFFNTFKKINAPRIDNTVHRDPSFDDANGNQDCKKDKVGVVAVVSTT